MATEQIYLETRDASTPGAVRVFNDAGEPFDFAAGELTYKSTLANCTTPYQADTERSEMAGAGKSAYTAALNLAHLNPTGENRLVWVRNYLTATPGNTAEPVDGGPMGLMIAYGERADNQPITLELELNLKTTEGQVLAVNAWVMVGAIRVPLHSLDSAATLAITFRETEAGADHLALPTITIGSTHRFESNYDTGNSANPVFSDDRSYHAACVVNANSYARTFNTAVSVLG